MRPAGRGAGGDLARNAHQLIVVDGAPIMPQASACSAPIGSASIISARARIPTRRGRPGAARNPARGRRERLQEISPSFAASTMSQASAMSAAQAAARTLRRRSASAACARTG